MEALAFEARRAERMSQIDAQFKAGKISQARLGLDQALVAEPRDTALLMLRGLALFKLRLWKEAQADFASARALAPEDPETWLGEGVSLAVQGEVYPALELLEEMLLAHPDFIRGRIQTARFYYKLCLTVKGKGHLDAALALEPSFEERREIDAIFKEEAVLDQKRIFRPDFETLKQAKAAKAGR